MLLGYTPTPVHDFSNVLTDVSFLVPSVPSEIRNDLDLVACQQAADEADEQVDPRSIQLSVMLLRSIRGLMGYMQPCVFGADKGRLEVAHQTSKKRLSVFVDGAKGLFTVVRYDIEADRLETVRAQHLDTAKEGFKWIFSSIKKSHSCASSVQTSINHRSVQEYELSLPAHFA